MLVIKNIVLLLVFTSIIYGVSADTPANCSYEEIRGVWQFHESDRSADRTEKCEGSQRLVNTVKVELNYPNIAVDEYGNNGTWTLIYNQGFEVIVNNRKYFAFSNYTQKGNIVTSYCHETQYGWSHDVLGHNWACFRGEKVDSGTPSVGTYFRYTWGDDLNELFVQNVDTINEINTKQNLWKAGYNRQFEGKTLREMLLMAGGPKSTLLSRPKPAPVTDEVSRLAAQLPDHFDWRNVSGVNFVTSVKDQRSCGSCYAFGAIGMIDSRLAIASNNTLRLTLSPQDVVSCSNYAQGCSGGFPYLIAGKYGQDFGLTLEENYPYVGRDTKCEPKKLGNRYYTASYNYVGGYYGGCNEALMRLSLVNNGPLAVSYNVTSNFFMYQSGIYVEPEHLTTTNDNTRVDYNPFEITNHVVVIVGYGVDAATGTKYWIVKNSWGESFGENGYFRIRRATDELNIESIAVDAFPIPN
ncbi:dipeptidyl peptidase 1-like [Oppia nitens]|uniref:dipeptidyl peptidase 1-like n=1 Tax=Oppia nitens TaxID=1686743 RepID=UPI0023DA4F54|nr:dipeptidyl peptidase 1-like [Oppia nitens]